MKPKLITVFILTLLLTSTLTVSSNIPPIMADTGTASIKGNHLATQKAEASNGPIQAGSHDGSQNQNLSKEGFQEDNSEPSAAEDKCDYNDTEKRSYYQWNLNETNEWAEFANVDDDSAELVIGINDAKSNSYDEITHLIVENGGILVSSVSMGGEIRAVVADIPLVTVSSFVTEVRAAGLSRYIEPNMNFQATFVPNDPYWPQQWGPRKIEADHAWDSTIGDPSVLVAVIDTGIDWNHPDLAANYVPLGYDWVNDDPDPMDDNGHGTHCAGIIAAVINNSVGIAGLAQVRIMAEKGLSAGGGGTEDDLARAIVHAVDCGADILSNSWGGYGESALIREAVRYAYDHGVLVVAAAGNEAWDVKFYPAAYDEVVAVTATDQYDYPAWFTNYGEWVELAAPGVDIYSTVWDDSYTYMGGTSMATPHVAGAAALIWSWFLNMSRDWVRLWLRQTADDLGDSGFDVYYGYGRVNARKAVEETPPDHDLLILNWERPPYVEPGMLATINTTVLNFGASNETDVTVQLLVNGTVVDSALIGFLATGESATVSCPWSPTVEGMYNLTYYVMPVHGETIIENNVVWAYVYVGFPVKAVVLRSAGTHYGDIISNWQVLNTNWYKFGNTMIYIDYTTLDIADITYDDIAATGADVLIISCASDPWMGWEFADSEIDAITRYIREGNGLIATAGTLYYGVPNNNKLAPLFGLNETITWYATGTDLLHIVNTTHPLFFNVPNPYCFPELGTAVPSDGRWDSNELAGGTYVALGHYQESAIVAYRGLVYISPWLEIIPAYYHFHLQLLYNAVTWSSFKKPEHELIVHLESPPALKPGNSTMLNATVHNSGLSNETDVDLQLLIDGSIIDSVTIPELLVGSSYLLSYSWTPTVEGTYNVTAYAPPLLGEEFMENNVESASVLVYYMMVALFKNVDPWGIPSNEEVLSLYRIPFIVFGSKDFGSIDLSLFSKVVITSDQDQVFYYAMDGYRWWFENYVSNGGLLEIHAADWAWHGGHWIGILPGGLQWVSYSSNYVTIVDTTHPVVTMPNTISDPELDYWHASVHGYFTNYTVDTRIVIIENYTGYPAYLEFQYGAGFIVASSQTLEWAYMHGYSPILENSLLYCKFPHDLAVFLETPTYVQPGDSTLLNATVYNLGLTNEIDVELRLLINSSLVNSVVIPELESGSRYTLSYMWTPMVAGRYNVTAYAPPLPDKEPTTNNIDSAMVFVRFVIYVLWDDVHDNDGDSLTGNYLSLYQLLSSSGFVVEELTSGTIDSKLLASYDILVLIDPELDFSSSEITEIQNWVAAGGSLFVIVDTGYPPTLNTLMMPSGVQTTGFASYYGTTTNIVSHPVTQDVSSIYYDLAWEIAVTSPSTTLAWTIENYAFLSATTTSKVVVISDSNIMDNGGLEMADNLQLMLNIFNWLIVFCEHDLAVSLETPRFLEPGDSSLLNATVQNRGLSNETNVELQLLINSSIVDSVVIPELLSGSSYTLSYMWTPVEATYNVTAYSPPVPNEAVTANNAASSIVRVGIIVEILYDESHDNRNFLDPSDPINHGDAWGYTTWAKIVTEAGYRITKWLPGDGELTLHVLSHYDILVISMARQSFTVSEISAIQTWVHLGGSLFLVGEANNYGGDPTRLNPVIIEFGIEFDLSGVIYDYVISDLAVHPVTVGLSQYEVSYCGVLILSPPSQWLGKNGTGKVALACSEHGFGRVVIAADTNTFADNYGFQDPLSPVYDHSRILSLNILDWLKIRYEHDLAVALDAPTFLGPGESTTLNATVQNRGLNNETNVQLFLLINDTIVNSTTIPELLIGASYSINYLWTPTVKAMYNVTAYAPPVPGENLTTNNLVSKMIRVHHVAVALISDHVELLAITHILDSMGIGYDIYNDNGIYLFTEDLSLLLRYDTVIFYTDYRHITSDEHTSLESYLSSGGNLLVTGFDSLISDGLLRDIIRSATMGDNVEEPDLYVMSAHPIVNGPYGSFPLGFHTPMCYSDCDLVEADVARDAVRVAELADGYDRIIATEGIPGKVVFWNGRGDHDWRHNLYCQVMFKNTISWMMPLPIPEHDLGVLLRAPSHIVPGTSTILRATVYNIGLNNETDVELELLINGSMVASTMIDELLSNSSYTMTYPWAPTVEGTYNVTAYVHPVPDEEILEDNVAMKMVAVFTIVGPYMFVNPLDSIVLRNTLFTINITLANVTDLYMWQVKLYFDAAILDFTDAWYPEDHVFAGRSFIPAEPALGADINGTYVMLGCSLVGEIPGFNGTGTLCQIKFRSIDWGGSTLRFSRPIPDDTFLWDSNLGYISFTVIDGFVDVVRYMPPLPLCVHDVAVLRVAAAPTQVYVGQPVNINVTVANQGNATETFTVTLYYNFTANATIGTKTVTNLLPDENKALIFIWNTVGVKPCNNYTITAVASTVPGETDITDNILCDGKVKIKIWGDINGDGKVDMRDVATISKAFGSYPGHPRWNPSLDLNNDGKIDMRDIVVVARNFGKCIYQ